LQAAQNRNAVKETVSQFQLHLRQARGFYEAGTKPKFDVTKAEVDLSNAELNLIKAENQLRLSRVTLNNAMGIPDAPIYELKDNLFYMEYKVLFEDALQKAYAQRPDLRSLSTRKEAAKESINLSRKGYLPSLSGNASYSYTGAGFPLNDSWGLGVNLTFPLFSGFSTDYQVAGARANIDTLSANEQALKQDIFLQLKQAYLNLREAGERITNTEVTIKQAKENQELAMGRYQAGVGSPIEVTDALVALISSEVAHISALADYKNAQSSIEKAIGVR
jgi:outer membrane protein